MLWDNTSLKCTAVLNVYHEGENEEWICYLTEASTFQEQQQRFNPIPNQLSMIDKRFPIANQLFLIHFSHYLYLVDILILKNKLLSNLILPIFQFLLFCPNSASLTVLLLLRK